MPPPPNKSSAKIPPRGNPSSDKKTNDATDSSVTDHPSPPGFKGNKDDGRELHTYIRKDAYTVEWGERSRVEILVGRELKDEYDHTGRLPLEVCREVAWPEYEEQGRLEIWYDEADGVFRASQSVTVSDDARNTPLADETAALDIGANTLVAATTTTGQQLLYEGRNLFERFRRQTEEIAEYQSLLDDQRRTSHRIDQLYRRRTRQRNHAQDALVRP